MKNWKVSVLIFTSLAHFINDGYGLMFSVLIAYYDNIQGVQLWVLGAIAIIYTLISGFISTPASIYADRRGLQKELMALGLLLDGISAPFFAMPFILPHYAYPLMGIGAVFLGIGQSLYHPMGAYLISVAFEHSSAPSAMGLNGSFGSLGRALFPILVVAVISTLGSFAGVNILGAVAIVSGILIQILLTGRNQPTLHKDIGKGQSFSGIGRFRYFILPVTAITFFRSMTLSASTTYAPVYVTRLFNSHILMGEILTISYATAIIGQPYFGRVTSKRGGRFTVTLTILASTLMFIVFLYVGKNLPLLLLSFSAYSFFAMSAFPVLLGYVSQVIPKEFSTTVSGITWGLGTTIGGAVGIALASTLILFGMSIYFSFWVLTAFSILASALLPFLYNRKLDLPPS